MKLVILDILWVVDLEQAGGLHGVIWWLMLVVGYLFILMAGFFVNGSDYVFVLMMVIVFLFNGGGWVFCLMLVVGFLFIVMVRFFVYGSDWVFVLIVVAVFFV